MTVGLVRPKSWGMILSQDERGHSERVVYNERVVSTGKMLAGCLNGTVLVGEFAVRFVNDLGEILAKGR